MSVNADEIVKLVNKCRERNLNKTTDEKKIQKINDMLNSVNVEKLIKRQKKADLEHYIKSQTSVSCDDNLFKLAKCVQFKYPDLLNKIIDCYIEQEKGYYLIKMITSIEKTTLNQSHKIIKKLLQFKQDRVEFADNICFIANHLLDLSNKTRKDEYKNEVVSYLIFEIFNLKNREKVLDDIHLELAKKIKTTNETPRIYIPLGEMYTKELNIFHNALEKYEYQIEKEIKQ